MSNISDRLEFLHEEAVRLLDERHEVFLEIRRIQEECPHNDSVYKHVSIDGCYKEYECTDCGHYTLKEIKGMIT